MSYYNQEQELEDFLKTTFQLGGKTGEIIDEINKFGDQHNLTLNELGMLYEKTKEVLAGKSPLQNLSSNILGRLEVPNSGQFKADLESLIKQIEKKPKSPKKDVPSIPQTTEIEIPPKNLPMIEKREVSHEVPHVETPQPPGPKPIPPADPLPTPKPPQEMVRPEQTKAPLPDYRYAEGKDPYREPLT